MKITVPIVLVCTLHHMWVEVPMTTRQTLLCLLLLALLGGCAAPKVMQPRTASLDGDSPSAKRCVGDDVCFVYRQD